MRETWTQIHENNRQSQKEQEEQDKTGTNINSWREDMKQDINYRFGHYNDNRETRQDKHTKMSMSKRTGRGQRAHLLMVSYMEWMKELASRFFIPLMFTTSDLRDALAYAYDAHDAWAYCNNAEIFHKFRVRRFETKNKYWTRILTASWRE